MHLNAVDPVSAIEPAEGKRVPELPAQWIIEPGVYSFRGKTYALQQEGLYRFLVPGAINAQRIVFDGDVEAFLSAIAWVVSHGNADNALSVDEKTRAAAERKLFLTCNAVSEWAAALLREVGVSARVVTTLTLDAWNDYDNGHTMLEVYSQAWKKWVLYDLDNDQRFQEQNVPLSFVEFARRVASGRYETVSLSGDVYGDISNFKASGGYDYGFYMEFVHADIRSWYRRVVQVPMIFDGKRYVHFDRDHSDRIHSYSSNYVYMDEARFMQTFYPVN